MFYYFEDGITKVNLDKIKYVKLYSHPLDEKYKAHITFYFDDDKYLEDYFDKVETAFAALASL